MKTLFLILALGFLTSCASIREMVCDCQPTKKAAAEAPRSKYSTKLKTSTNKSTSTSTTAKEVAEDKSAGEAVATISGEDQELEILAEMTEAMDAYIFKKDESMLAKACLASSIQCYVNNKIYPKTKKKLKRKAPAYMTGSKMGLHDGKSVQVRYEYFK